jgi:hypothetical protein
MTNLVLQNENWRLWKKEFVLAMRLNIPNKLIAGLSRQLMPPVTQLRLKPDLEMDSSPLTQMGTSEQVDEPMNGLDGEGRLMKVEACATEEEEESDNT